MAAGRAVPGPSTLKLRYLATTNSSLPLPAVASGKEELVVARYRSFKVDGPGTARPAAIHVCAGEPIGCLVPPVASTDASPLNPATVDWSGGSGSSADCRGATVQRGGGLGGSF